jgi:hypothetical protein
VLSLVAEVDRRVVGHAMFSTVTLPHTVRSRCSSSCMESHPGATAWFPTRQPLMR